MIIDDKARGFYPIDMNGKITIQDLIDTINANGGGDGGSAENLNGFFNYNNSLPNQMITADQWTTMLNDGLGTFTETRFAPKGITSMLDGATGRYSLAGLKPGDEVQVRHTLNLTPYMNNIQMYVRNFVGQEGSAYSISMGPPVSFDSGAGVPSGIFVISGQFFIRDENTRIGGFLPQILTTGQAEMEYIGCYVSVNRR